MPVILGGNAAHWYSDYIRKYKDDPEKLTWISITTSLCIQFFSAYQQTYTKRKLFSMKQGSIQSVQTYFWKIKSLTNRLELGNDEEIIKNLFINGLNSNIRTTLKLEYEKNLD